MVPTASQAAGPTITTTAHNGTFSTTSFTQDLYDTAQVTSDGVKPATTGSVRFRLYGPDDTTCGGPIDFTSTNPVVNGSATSGTTTPPVGGTYQWVADYLGPDGTTVLASSPCNSANESTVHAPFPSVCTTTPVLCNPVSTISTTAEPGSTAALGAMLSDKAAVTNGFPAGASPAITGTVTFSLYGPGDPTCTGTPVYTDAGKPVASGLASSGGFTTTAAGTYHWVASYSGTGPTGFPPVSGTCGDTSETTTVAKATPALAIGVKDATTGNSWNGTQAVGAKAFAAASLGGTVADVIPAGTVSYSFYPGGGCSGTSTAEQVNLTGTGSIPSSSATAALSAGAYSYRATYSGDPDYEQVTSSCADFSVAAAPPGPAGAGCVVPVIGKGASSRAVADQLGAAGCALGHVAKRFSRKVKRGKLIKLKTKAGTELPAGTRIDAVFSKGKRKR